MKFDKLMLDDYMQTAEGVRVASFFRTIKRSYRNRFKDEAFFKFVGSLLTVDLSRDYFSDAEDQESIAIDGDECVSFDEFEQCFSQEFDDEYEARNFQPYVPKYSVELYCAYPEYAIPYLFVRDFHKMKTICEMLEMPLPLLPGARWHGDRFNYYFKLCRAFYDFRIEHGLSPLELSVLIYGFAARFLSKFIDKSYGEANRVYIVGATQYDVEEGALRSPTEASISVWQGNEEMLPGDIVLVYETAPYSRIRSIWRAISPGFDDPFTYYPGAVYLGHPILVPCVGIRELREDPVWSKKGLVKASMQGVNGKTCTVEEYEALKKMFKRADGSFDLNLIPNPPPYARFYHETLKVERDVEEQLLEPLLKRMGVRQWVRQLPLRMGRGDRVFPDYAIGVHGRGDDAAADFVWEAKYRIPSIKQLKIDFGQAKSYALRLQSRAFGLVAMEGVWFVTQADGFRFERRKHLTWEQLGSSDSLAELKQAFR